MRFFMPLTKSAWETLPVRFGSSWLKTASPPAFLNAAGGFKAPNACSSWPLVIEPLPLVSICWYKLVIFCCGGIRALAPDVTIGGDAPEIREIVIVAPAE